MSILIAAAVAWLGAWWPTLLVFLVVWAALKPKAVKAVFERFGFDLNQTKEQWAEILPKKNDGKVKASDNEGRPLN